MFHEIVHFTFSFYSLYYIGLLIFTISYQLSKAVRFLAQRVYITYSSFAKTNSPTT